MTREERNNAIKVLKNSDLNNPKVNSLLFSADEITNAFNMAIKALEQEPVIDKLRTEIKSKIEEEEFARAVFRHEEKDTVKAEQCYGKYYGLQ